MPGGDKLSWARRVDETMCKAIIGSALTAGQPRGSDGMGMGLCIARTIIEAHGGKLSVETRSSGAVFYVSLPLAKASHRGLPPSAAGQQFN